MFTSNIIMIKGQSYCVRFMAGCRYPILIPCFPSFDLWANYFFRVGLKMLGFEVRWQIQQSCPKSHIFCCIAQPGTNVDTFRWFVTRHYHFLVIELSVVGDLIIELSGIWSKTLLETPNNGDGASSETLFAVWLTAQERFCFILLLISTGPSFSFKRS